MIDFFLADPAQKFSIAIRFLFFNRDHDSDQNFDPDQPRSGFYFQSQPDKKKQSLAHIQNQQVLHEKV